MSAQQNDELYQQYDKNNADRIQKYFGHSTCSSKGDSLNRATTILRADKSMSKYLHPRLSEDEKITRFILRNGFVTIPVFESNRPNITDDDPQQTSCKQQRDRVQLPSMRRQGPSDLCGQTLDLCHRLTLIVHGMQFIEVQSTTITVKESRGPDTKRAAPRTLDMSQSNKKQFHTKKKMGMTTNKSHNFVLSQDVSS